MKKIKWRQEKGIFSSLLLSLCLSLFTIRYLSLVLLIWTLDAGGTGAINHALTGVDMSFSVIVMTGRALFPVFSHSRDGLWTQFISLATFQRSIHSSCSEPIRSKKELLISYGLPPFKGFSSSVAIVWHNAARRNAQYHPHIYFQGLLLSSFESPQRRTPVCLSGKPRCSFKDFREAAWPRFEFAGSDTGRFKMPWEEADETADTTCKVVLFPFFLFYKP